MKERSILFSAPMVRSLLANTKTQTRRTVKPQPVVHPSGWLSDPHWQSKPFGGLALPTIGDLPMYCPYGQPGDRLVVRETFYAFGRWETRFSAKKGRDEWHFIDMTVECGRAYGYDADEDTPMVGGRNARITPMWWRRPAIFMPRAASRILLEVAEARVERLQECNWYDALAEGITLSDDPDYFGVEGQHLGLDPRETYASLWNQINGEDSWAANPWVWAVSFRRIS